MRGKDIHAPLEAVRRLAVTKQHLAGSKMPTSSTETILSIVRDIAYVQWDPVTVVAPSHMISLWSRIRNFRPPDLERLLWKEKKTFEHWTPIATVVLTEDYPLYHSFMSRYPESLTDSWGSHRERARKFLAQHADLRKRMLNELKKRPLRLDQFRDYRRTKRSDDGWTPGSIVSTMLFHMHMSGDVMVAGHEGNNNIWGLTEDVLPRNVMGGRELPAEEAEKISAQRAIRALGTATPKEITYYFLRGRYHNLKGALEHLLEEYAIHPVHVDELGPRDRRYVHENDVSLLESLSDESWEPQVSLIAPFDNLICGRERTSRLFGFEYVHEQFLPKERRKYGTYVLPILYGETIIGRLDPRLDRGNDRLIINSIHAEPDAPGGRVVSSKIYEAIERLAEFVGAKEVEYPSHIPEIWANTIH